VIPVTNTHHLITTCRFFCHPRPPPEVSALQYQQLLLTPGGAVLPSNVAAADLPRPTGLLSALLHAAAVQPAGLQRVGASAAVESRQMQEPGQPAAPGTAAEPLPLPAPAGPPESTAVIPAGVDPLLLNQWQVRGWSLTQSSAATACMSAPYTAVPTLQYKHEVMYLLGQVRAVERRRGAAEARLSEGEAVAAAAQAQLRSRAGETNASLAAKGPALAALREQQAAHAREVGEVEQVRGAWAASALRHTPSFKGLLRLLIHKYGTNGHSDPAILCAASSLGAHRRRALCARGSTSARRG
jgi:hypothetical protein